VTPLTGTALAGQAQADAKKAEAVANMVKAVTNALLLGGSAIAEGLQVVRLRGLVGNEELLVKLRKLAQDDSGLEDLLRRTGDAAEVENLLTRAGSATAAKKILDTRELFRQRFADRYAKDLAAIEKVKAENPELANIPTEDLVALRGYTAEDYDMINRALRGQETEAEMERLQPYIDSITSGLDQLPVFKGTVSRIENDTYAMYQPGEVVTKEGFTSSYGTGAKIPIKGNTSLTIESLTGRNIAAVAKNPGEAEVLFKASTRFQVVSNTQPLRNVNWHKVHLREVP
jgi:NAD:arginine ADP-ribosyltransferase